MLLTGHANLLAIKDNITANKEFNQSVIDNAQAVLDSGNPNPLEICTAKTISRWDGKLGNLEAFMSDHCIANDGLSTILISLKNK